MATCRKCGQAAQLVSSDRQNRCTWWRCKTPGCAQATADFSTSLQLNQRKEIDHDLPGGGEGAAP